MVRVLISTVAAAIILFVWGFLSWAVLPMHQMETFQDEAAVSTVLRDNALVSGVYFLPHPPDESDQEAVAAWTDRHKTGPRAMVALNITGSDPMSPKLFGMGFAINLATGLVLSVLLAWVRRMPGGYVARVLLIVGIGLIVGLEADLKYWNWLYVPSDWSFMNVIDHVIGFGLAGLAMAAIIKPPHAPEIEGV